MANVKISELASASTPLAGTEVLPIVQSSATVKVSVANLTAGRAVSAASLTTTGTINDLTVGRGAGSVATNTAVGASALAANTTGAGNTAIGNLALAANTSGSNNVGVGAYDGSGTPTLRNNTTGARNVAVGNGSLATNTTGTNNTALGHTALFSNSTASYNTGIGYESLYSNTTADGNTAFGYQAGYTNTTGTYNTYVGWHAGYIATGGGNSYLGTTAGYAMTTGSKNTIIGAYGGNQSGLDIRTASNRIVLSDGDGNVRGYFNDSGNFAVGTVSPDGSTKVTIQGASGGNGMVVKSGSDGNYGIYFNNAANSTVGGIIINSGSVAYNTTSDYRLKENIAPMTGALAKVAQLKPCTYTWKATGESAQGFIAHELQAVIPDAVSGAKDAVNADGSIKSQGIDTSFLVATLTAAIQELKAEFDAYKASHP